MGATTFSCSAKGKTAKDAFQKAREAALYEYGHRGYTGTIAEKGSFRMVYGCPAKTAKTKIRWCWDLLDGDSCPSWLDDKWGAAGCIEIRKGEFFFFGWASC